MFDIYQFDAPSRVGSNYSFLQPGIAHINKNLQLSYVNAQGQLAIQEQFESEQIQNITKQKITSQTLTTIEGQPVIVCGIEEINQQGHLMIYNQQQKRLIGTQEVDSKVSKVLSCTNDIILTAQGDQIHCYRLSLSKTVSNFQELFWVDASSEVADLFMISTDIMSRKMTFASLTRDNYLRVFTNDEFQAEVRPFPRVKYTKIDQFQGFFGILTENKKFKMYFYDATNQKFRPLVSQDIPPNYTGFCFIFKPYARQLQHISNKGQPEIEKMLQIPAPIPFIVLYNQKHSKITLNFIDLVENKLVLKILLIQKVKTQNVVYNNKIISNPEQFETFMSQYIQNFELEQDELPFTADDTKQTCKQLISFVNMESGTIYEFPIVFNFIELLQYIQDMDEEGAMQQLGITIPKLKQQAGDKTAQPEQSHKKKKRSKGKKQMETVEGDLSQFYALQTLHDQLYQLMKATSAAKEDNVDQQMGFSTGQLGLSIDKKTGTLVTSNNDVKLINWAMHFDRVTNIGVAGSGEPQYQQTRKSILYGDQQSNYEQYSDIVMLHNSRLAPTLEANEYNVLNFLQKQRFHQGASTGSKRDPLPLNNSQQQVDCFVSFKLSAASPGMNGQEKIFSRTFPLTTYVLPGYSMISSDTPPDDELMDEKMTRITLYEVNVDQLKICYRLQALETPAPTSVGGFKLICSSLGRFSREFHPSTEKPSVLCKWHEGEMIISSINVRAALNYALVFSRASGWSGNYNFCLGTTVEKNLISLLRDAFQIKSTTGDLGALQAENATAITMFAAQITQKRFNASFQQLNGIIRQQLTSIKTQFETLKVNEDVICNIQEILQLFGWAPTAQKQLDKLWKEFLRSKISVEDFVEYWRVIEG